MNDWLQDIEKWPEEDAQDREAAPIQYVRICPQCRNHTLTMMHDQFGLYYKCCHCGWDTAGLYKTKNKFRGTRA